VSQVETKVEKETTQRNAYRDKMLNEVRAFSFLCSVFPPLCFEHLLVHSQEAALLELKNAIESPLYQSPFASSAADSNSKAASRPSRTEKDNKDSKKKPTTTANEPDKFGDNPCFVDYFSVDSSLPLL
jgi:hypothetical protein